MMLFSFGLTGLGVQRRHEFGHESMPKILQIDCLVFSVFVFGQKGGFFQYMRDYFQWRDHIQAPQYRQQVKRNKSKILAQERKYTEMRIGKTLKENEVLKMENAKLKSDAVVLRNLAYAVRNIKNISDADLNKID